MRRGSAAIRARAQRVLPGGVDSPVRAFTAVGGEPPVAASGQGARVRDADGREWLDHILAYGPHILGHRHPAVTEALQEQARQGTAFGMTCELEVALAERVVAAVPGLEMVRFVNSGTEATMSALRLARAATGRDLVITCAGGYHGHADAFLASAGSGLATLGIPGSPGVPAAAVAGTIVVPYNDAAAVEAVLAREPDRVAAVVVEPVAGNMGCVPPQPGYLQALRRLTREAGVVLVFDEVMSGFRVAYGGAAELYGVAADLTCLGKVIGGGLPVGAYGGGRALMELMAPAGPVYQAGTLSGNPLAMAAGIAVLDVLRHGSAYELLESLGARLEGGMRAAAVDAGVPCAVNRVGSMITAFIGVQSVTDFASASASDLAAFARLHRSWRDAGVLWPPSQFESGFLCTAHTDADLDLTVSAFRAALSGGSGKT
ncbi:MAG: glutamate-1-semialdehyde 2,1-aminomutase [Candidatus Dormibacteria bacterium]